MIDEKELQEIVTRFVNMPEGFPWIKETGFKLTTEIRRLNELLDKTQQGSLDWVSELKQENQRLSHGLKLHATWLSQKIRESESYKQALEKIKEKCKDAGAYTLAAEVYYIAHVELKGEEE